MDNLSRHRFRYEKLIAECFLDKDEIQFISEDGEVLTVVALDELGESRKAA